MSLGDFIYKGNDLYFFARSRSNPVVFRAYKANRVNRTLLFDTFRELVDNMDLAVGDRVLYAHRSGSIKRLHVSCIVYGESQDLSDRDYQVVDRKDGNVFNTTRDRLTRDTMVRPVLQEL